jgi:hypothetical protein
MRRNISTAGATAAPHRGRHLPGTATTGPVGDVHQRHLPRQHRRRAHTQPATDAGSPAPCEDRQQPRNTPADFPHAPRAAAPHARQGQPAPPAQARAQQTVRTHRRDRTDKLDRQRSHRSDRRTSAIPCPAGAPLPSPAGHAVHHHTVTSPNVTTKALFSPPDATHQAPALAPRADTDSHHVSQFTIASRIHQLAINA